MKKSEGVSICPICELSVLTYELQRHANSHFEEEDNNFNIDIDHHYPLSLPIPPFLPNNNDIIIIENSPPKVHQSEGSSSSTSSREYRDCRHFDLKVSYAIGSQIPANFYLLQPCLISLLKTCLELESGNSISFVSGYVDHFQSIRSEDVGWGCGWRNIQILTSHLLSNRNDANRVLFAGCGFVPDISSLQRWLEIAWDRGFDNTGSTHFGDKIYGKKNWIGTTECATLFRSFGLRARIVDFDSQGIYKRSSLKGCEGIKVSGPMDKFLKVDSKSETGTSSVTREMKGQQVLIDWVWNYFSDKRVIELGNDRVISSEKAPLYFQHQGHSRTIVGIQVTYQKKGAKIYNLLVLDPGHITVHIERALKENNGWQKLIKRGVHTLKKPQYQLCYVDSGIAHREEIELLKTLDSLYIEL